MVPWHCTIGARASERGIVRTDASTSLPMLIRLPDAVVAVVLVLIARVPAYRAVAAVRTARPGRGGGGRLVFLRRVLSTTGVAAAMGACRPPTPATAEIPTPSSAASATAPSPVNVVADDVARFWAMYDTVRAVADSGAQVALVRERYVARGTPGLAAFVAARGYTPEAWVGAIRAYPRFWASIRPHTLPAADTIARGLAAPLARLRALYPASRPAGVYVTIGALGSGGTTQDSLVLIGAELASGGPDVDVGEFTGGMRAFLTRYFASTPRRTLVPLTVHEVVHTQQRGIGRTVLARALREGSADLVAELATGTRIPLPYMTAGPVREAALRERFRADLFTPRIGRWFYDQTSTDPAHVPDLGYYMGYAIARAYLARTADTLQAIRDMIELPFDDEAAVEAFLRRSGYYAEPIDRAALLRAYEARRPTVRRVVVVDGAARETALARDAIVDPAVTTLRIEFSAPLDPVYNSIDYGPGGTATWPIVARPGFGADARSFTVRVALAPGRRYGFVVEAGFRTGDGYPLRPDTVTFTTGGRADRP